MTEVGGTLSAFLSMIKAIRGTRDLLPPETALWNFVEAAVRDVFRAYNFREIRTPIFEATELFSRSVGEETDIVSKEMYTWEDGARAADYAVFKKWITTRIPNTRAFDYIDPYAAQPGSPVPSLRIELDGKDNFVVFRFRFTFESYRLLKLACEQTTYAASNFQLRLVTADNVPQNYKRLMEQDGVILETVEVDAKPELLTLRPENTAGVVRAYIEHSLDKRGLNKLYYIGPQFRRERPQKGRYRQFYQIGAEVIGPATAGSESPARDAELLELLATLLDRLGIKGWQLQLNSIGCANDRAAYNEALRTALEPVKDKMCADCQRRAVTNPLRVFDCKVPEDQPIIEKLPRISQFLDEPCRQHFQQVQEILKSVGVEFHINDRLVRGLDYYTRTAFEFTHGALGAQNAILGGGRYDGLSEALGGPPAPGIGFAIGEDRLVMSLGESAEAVFQKPNVYIAPLGAGMNKEAARLARELRRHDIVVELGDESFRLKKSLETASKLGARFALIAGENELSTGVFALKNLATGQQESVPRNELAQRIQAS
jgi:histidyl-tRNA synthetase